MSSIIFFFNDTATTEIYTLSLHDALPISVRKLLVAALRREPFAVDAAADGAEALRLTASVEYAVIILDLMMPRLNGFEFRSEEHTSELQSQSNLVCRLLLEKKTHMYSHLL